MREAGRERRQGGNAELMRQMGQKGAREREGGGDTNAKQETGTRQSDF